MKRTISIKLKPTTEQSLKLGELQLAFSDACNQIVPATVEHRCYNRVALHHSVYYKIREAIPDLGSQMVCNAIASVCQSYKSLVANNPDLKKQPLPAIKFKSSGSVHFDKRTYSMKGDTISLFTLTGREKIVMHIGDFQRDYIKKGTATEAELILKGKAFYFNLVLDLPDSAPVSGSGILGVDLGENNIASTSSGKLFGGGKLRHDRDKFLALRSRLQSKGTQSAKQLLRKVSGQEARHVKHVNHEVSKAIVAEALQSGSNMIVMENLTNIRKRIKAGKRMRSRLHRWAWAELQTFVEYKAIAAGIRVEYVNPAYTSQRCSVCGSIGKRIKHSFSCSTCGSLAHSDGNAAKNIAQLGSVFTSPTREVIHGNVGLACQLQ